MTASLGEQWAAAYAAKDRDALAGLLADEVDFRGMTPGRHWQARTPVEVVDEIVLRYWLEPSEAAELVSVATGGQVGDREHVAYRFRIRNPDGTFIAEQQAYYVVTDGRIDWLRIMCSGASPETVAGPMPDADDIGRACAVPPAAP